MMLYRNEGHVDVRDVLRTLNSEISDFYMNHRVLTGKRGGRTTYALVFEETKPHRLVGVIREDRFTTRSDSLYEVLKSAYSEN